MWTDDEILIIEGFVTVITGKTNGREWKIKRCEVARRIKEMIDEYGDDCYGDKPDGMNRAEYWISHLDFE